MRFTGKPVGPLGLGLLTVTAITGVALAVHGWSGRHSGLPAGALAASGSSQSAPSSTPGATPAGPTASSGASPGASPSASTGPPLSSQSYAQYSFRVWPGALGAAAKSALTGLTVKVTRQGSGIKVNAGVTGQPTTPHFYAHGAAVYVVEASMGDDSSNTDYSLGDDGLVVTDAQGRITQ